MSDNNIVQFPEGKAYDFNTSEGIEIARKELPPEVFAFAAKLWGLDV